jgi:hypothetical protein
LLPHIVIVRPFLGSGPYGDGFGDPTVHRAFVEDRRRLVRSASGEEVTSETTVYSGPEVAVPVGSQVTAWAGTPHERTARVITTSRYEHPGSWSHLEIALAWRSEVQPWLSRSASTGTVTPSPARFGAVPTGAWKPVPNTSGTYPWREHQSGPVPCEPAPVLFTNRAQAPQR